MASGVAVWWVMSIFMSYPCITYCLVNCGCIVSFSKFNVDKLLITVTTSLLLFIVIQYFTSVFPWLQHNEDISNIILYTKTAIAVFIAINIFFNYFNCIKIHPNSIGNDKLDLNEDELVKSFYVHDPDLLQFNNETIRYCDKCKNYKPWRSYHCSRCKQCILRKDHHCPYVGNCVGFANHRYFHMFITYLWIGTMTYIYLSYPLYTELYEMKDCSIWTLGFTCHIENKFVESEGYLLFLLSYLLCWSIFIIMAVFVSMYNFMLCTNQTQVEFSGAPMITSTRTNLQLRGIRYIYYLNSFVENIQQVFGKKWYLALLPIKTYPLGNGRIYPLRKDVHDLVFESGFNESLTRKLLS